LAAYAGLAGHAPGWFELHALLEFGGGLQELDACDDLHGAGLAYALGSAGVAQRGFGSGGGGEQGGAWGDLVLAEVLAEADSDRHGSRSLSGSIWALASSVARRVMSWARERKPSLSMAVRR